MHVLKHFRYKLILEGSLHLRRPNKAPVQVHILLMEEMVVILQKESEKFILKFFQSGSPTQMAPYSPIIKMNTLLVRENAVCKYIYNFHLKTFLSRIKKGRIRKSLSRALRVISLVLLNYWVEPETK